jgi:tRNA isopentenyl-2-thiomethyl-A-37 hydroxylase MiaE
MTTSDFTDELATRYVEICLEKWTDRGLPVAHLAASFATKGLELAARMDGPERVADGLERMADAVRHDGRVMGVA